MLVGGLWLSPLAAVGVDSRSVPLSARAALPWYQRPLRILQTVLRESDARGYDVAAVVAYLRQAACNTLVVNGGGIVDFFPNPLPLANPDPFLGTRDLLGDITAACQAAGIRVLARVDFRGVEERCYRQQPDWFGRAADGGPLVLDYTTPPLFAGCYTSYHRNEHAAQFITHLLRTYPLDGIWHNSVAFGGVCYCERCREQYRAAGGVRLPDVGASPPRELDDYMRWKAAAAARHVARLRATVKSFGEEKAYAAEVFGSLFESGGPIWSGIDLYSARDHFDFLIATAFLSENSPTIHYEPLHHSATLVRFMKSMTPEKEAVILYGDNGTSHRYIMDAPVETRVWLWEALSVGGRFWNCSFTGMHPNATHDRRAAFNSVPVFEFVRDHEATLTAHAPAANVGVFYSRATRQFYRTPAPEGDTFAGAIRGVESVLLSSHIPYDFIPDDQLTPARLARYRVIILPNVRCLGDAELTALRDYVRQGGGLLATFATSLFDAAGTARPDFGLADVFGCSFTGSIADTRKDTYQFILDRDHPVVAADARETELLLTYGRTLLCRAHPAAHVVCTHVPTVNNQPPEKAWVPAWSREFPTLIDHQFGRGRCVYFANQPDQNSFDLGHPDVRRPLERAVRHLASGELPIVETTAPTSVHLGLTRSLATPSEFILSFVNTSSAPERPLRELLPVGPISVTLKLGGPLAERRVLRAPGACEVTSDGELIRIKLERLEEFAAVHLRLAAAT